LTNALDAVYFCQTLSEDRSGVPEEEWYRVNHHSLYDHIFVLSNHELISLNAAVGAA